MLLLLRFWCSAPGFSRLLSAAPGCSWPFLAGPGRSLPFLAFEIPLVGEALTKCRHTAYDQTGQLVVKLHNLVEALKDRAMLRLKHLGLSIKEGSVQEEEYAIRAP